MGKNWHTPWKISSGLSEHASSIRITDANGVWVASALGSHDKTLPCGCEQKVQGFPTDAEAEDIARLILVAPNLLGALKGLLQTHDTEMERSVAVNYALATIARATEEKP